MDRRQPDGDTITMDDLFLEASSRDIRRRSDGDPYSRIDVITNGGKLRQHRTVGRRYLLCDVELLHDYGYFYAKMVEADGDRIVTSPIWVETGAGLVASDFSIEDAFLVKGRQASFYARIADRTGGLGSEVGYELFERSTDGYAKKAEGSLSVEPGRWSL